MRACLEREERDRQTQFIFDGLVFVYPFICLCCGVQITANQWGFGRACGACDCGRGGECCSLKTRWQSKDVHPHVMRFIDGEIVQIDVRDMMKLRHLRQRTPRVLF